MKNQQQTQSVKVEVKSFDTKIIYIYKHLDVKSHEGWLKVGETLKSRITGSGKNQRIADQNSAANVAYEVLYTTDAVTNGGKIFSDTDIHAVLKDKNIECEKTQNPDTKRDSEWFKTDLDTIIDVIDKYKSEAIETRDGIVVDFRLRKEQERAVAKTAEYYENCLKDSNIEPAFLWNAKPRFGKTLTAYCFARAVQAKKVLIVTNRPTIANSWYEDFKKFDFNDTNQNDGKFRWIFTSSESVKRNLNGTDVYTRTEQKDLKLLSKNMVHFISLQDIKGRSGIEVDKFKANNAWIFELGQDNQKGEWDLIIIDESHEGADTGKALRVFESVHHKFALHLSGTPFKALASNKFSDSQIFNWSYNDEQEAKTNWSLADGPNPYAGLPKMNIFTYQLSRALVLTAEEARSEDSEYAFDLGEFFRVAKIDGEDKFVYEDKVKLFIQKLSDENFEYPFSNADYRDSLRHTFWLLPGVKACQQMKNILLEDAYFKENYAPEDIIMAAGDGDEDRLTKSALDEVRKRIGKEGGSKHPLQTRTITLSCGQLTTGVTVPAWTGVLMLNNCKSPSLYMQTAFRAQNPFTIATSGGECYTKENCFVFDFAPDRILQTLAEMADSGVSDKERELTREEKVKILANFLPVIAEDDEGRMKYLDANEILSIPLKLVTEEVVSRGFMSNRLFENISGIFGCPQSITDIISKMDEAKDKNVVKDSSKKSTIKSKPKIWLDKDKKVHINEDIVVATTNGLLGDKKYVEIGSEEGKEVQNILMEAKVQAKAAGHSNEAINAEIKELEKKLPQLVPTLPEPEPQPGDDDYFEKENPDDAPKKGEKTEEEKVRDRLRGFARTIPSFLMAYGSAETKLENFGDNIPDNVFLELTNITKDEFLQLRDGMDYMTENEQGEMVPAHFNGLFNETVFNSSVQAFNIRRKTLAAYYREDAAEDIFEYIPPQATNQIFTPKRVVKMMIDNLESSVPGIFKNTGHTFIDLFMKSGLFITEIVRRIFKETRAQYNSDFDCVKHILECQVYGFAPTEILDAITKNYIFGFDAEGKISRNNFKLFDATDAAKNGNLNQMLNVLFNQKNMKFTAVVGNPPYQGENHQQIYPDFYLSARKLGEYVSLIFPTGWQEPKTANGLGKLNSREIKEDKQIIFIDNRQNVFPDVAGAEWVNIILWKKGYNNGLDGKQKILRDGKEEQIMKLAIKKSDIAKPFEIVELAKIIIEKQTFKSLSAITSSLKPYGLRTDVAEDPSKYGLKPIFTKKQRDDDVKIYAQSGKFLYVPKDYVFPVKISLTSFQMYKVFVPYAWGNMSENTGLGGAFSDIIIGMPNEACIETYLESGGFKDYETSKKHAKYLMTKFARAALYVNKHSQHSTTAWGAVPQQDYSEPWWNDSISDIDEHLFDKYQIPNNIRKFIRENIQPRTEANIVNYK